MKTTDEFLKLRSTSKPMLGEWNINYDEAVDLAKKTGNPIVVMWSNGDGCAYCISTEKCLMTKYFQDWMKKANAYFVFQYSGDKDKGKIAHDWIFNKTTKIKQYPGFRITTYDNDGNMLFDAATTGNKLRENRGDEAGAKNIAKKLDEMFAKVKPAPEPEPKPTPKPVENVKVRLNEKLTTAQVNKILDAIDKNDGYCPCQPKGDGTKCHCEDFVERKDIGEPCICKIYVKQKK